MKEFLLSGFFLCALIGAAQGKDWQVDTADSTLSFTGEQSGKKFEGGFKKFTANISFDPEHPEAGHITAIIDIASIYAGDVTRDVTLPKEDWFDSTVFPQAQFITTAIHEIAPGHYEADATLTIKGITRPIALPFTLAPEMDHWRAKGKVTLTRTDFGIGQGIYASEDYVKYPVEVTIDLAAKPLP